MKYFIISVFFFSLASAYCCEYTKNQENSSSIDTTNVKIGTFRATPKPSFDFNSIKKYTGDTLDIVTCSEYVYAPFGIIKGKNDLQYSLLKNFNVKNRIDTLPGGAFEFQILQQKSSKLILFFDDDPEATKSSYVLKGEISDNDVNFADNIKIGMTIYDFIGNFFMEFPPEMVSSCKVISLTSCVDGIKHIYTFNNDKLTSVKFVTETYWTISY